MFHSCLVPLILSAFYLPVYIGALIFILVKNHFRFTRQILLVLVVLFMALAVQTISCAISYIEDREEEESKFHSSSLSHSLFLLDRTMTMTIYMFLVCRMLYIYTRLEEGHKQTWKHQIA